ncbi:hypothetical protein DINM_005037 [Dirofilaria immitis]|nr:hypothetical protein [Dirofilaria immitis]
MMLTLASLCIINIFITIVESNVSIGLLRKDGRKPKPSGYGNRPRGVPFARGPFYATGETFVCVDNSKSIPYSQVNDDYCDCPDGSDEPGTSACPNAKFHCLNRGFKAEDLPSNRIVVMEVMSGIVRLIVLIFVMNWGEISRRNAPKIELAKQGFLKRLEMAATGRQLKAEKLEKLEILRKEMDEIKELRSNAQIKLDEKNSLAAEARKKHEEVWKEEKDGLKQKYAKILFNAFDLNKDEKITLDELKLAKEFDTNGDGAVSDDEIKSKKFSLALFVLNFSSKLVGGNEIDATRKTEPNESTVVKIPRIPNIDLNQPAFDEETQAIMKGFIGRGCKKEYDNLDKRYTDLELSIKDSEQYDSDDFGIDMAWASLKGKCFEMDENEYTYKLCLFDKAVQRSRNSVVDTDLGKWSGWIGTEPDKYILQSYQKGTPCWNGPDRSTKVVTECGEETQLVEASEPSKCEYLFILRSPAACPDPATITDQHEEL